jgi:rhodanese-related sulfurtransferase
MTLTPITAKAAAQMLAQGALLVDIRGAEERAALAIPAAQHAPLTALPDRIGDGTRPVIFHCKSGMRTQVNAAALAARAAGAPAYALTGGIDAWAAAGLPVTEQQAARPRFALWR